MDVLVLLREVQQVQVLLYFFYFVLLNHPLHVYQRDVLVFLHFQPLLGLFVTFQNSMMFSILILTHF